MEEPEEIKSRKMQELKERLLQKQELEQKRAEQEMQLEMLLKSALTPEAKNKLSNVRLVNQELYGKAVQALAYLNNAGKIVGKLSEEELKSILSRLNERKEIIIKRK